MRKHDVRKWLHAILDLLPVILIPVFMIYSHRHDVTERTDVEVTYKYQSNEVNTLDDLVEGNIYQFNCVNKGFDEMSSNQDMIFFELLTPLQINDERLVFSEALYITEFTSNTFLQFFHDVNDNCEINVFGSYEQFLDFEYTTQYIYSGQFLNNCYIRLLEYDLYLPNTYIYYSYTDYNVIENVEINDTKSSVMNVFMDDFNNSIDKYFNMGNVFNLGGVYEWFNTNIFSGNAPTIIYSIWNIALYELVMDLLFLLYGLFMWFIDIVENIMNKPFKSIK